MWYLSSFLFRSQFHPYGDQICFVFQFLFVIAGVTYKFDNSKHSWVVKYEVSGADNEELENTDNENKDDNVIKQDMSSGTYGYEGDNPTYTDATDGTVYIWDREKNAWFPKVRIPVTWTS
jgi:HIV Tat-specific factor 1